MWIAEAIITCIVLAGFAASSALLLTTWVEQLAERRAQKEVREMLGESVDNAFTVAYKALSDMLLGTKTPEKVASAEKENMGLIITAARKAAIDRLLLHGITTPPKEEAIGDGDNPTYTSCSEVVFPGIKLCLKPLDSVKFSMSSKASERLELINEVMANTGKFLAERQLTEKPDVEISGVTSEGMQDAEG